MAAAYWFTRSWDDGNAAISDFDNYGVSNNPIEATFFSRRAWIFGRTGWCANRLIEGARFLRLDLPGDDRFKAAFERLKERRERPKEPVLILMANAPSRLLHEPNGCLSSEYYGEMFPDEIQWGVKSWRSKSIYRLDLRDDGEEIKKYMIRQPDFASLREAWKEIVRSIHGDNRARTEDELFKNELP